MDEYPSGRQSYTALAPDTLEQLMRSDKTATYRPSLRSLANRSFQPAGKKLSSNCLVFDPHSAPKEFVADHQYAAAKYKVIRQPTVAAGLKSLSGLPYQQHQPGNNPHQHFLCFLARYLSTQMPRGFERISQSLSPLTIFPGDCHRYIHITPASIRFQRLSHK